MDKKYLIEKILYIACIVIAIIVTILNIIDIFNLLSINHLFKITTILLDIELILFGIIAWAHNRIISILCICVAIILMIFTLI